MMGNMHWWVESDWKASEESFRKAISIDPNHARAHACLSWLLTILGRPEEAMEHIERAIALDPYHPFVRESYASVLLRVGRYDDSISVCREIYENNPTDWGIQYNFYVAYRLTGRYEESLAAQRIYLTEGILKDFDHAFDQYEKLGYIGTLKLEIETLLEQSESQFLPPNPLAELYLYIGDKERALDCLEQTYEMRHPDLPLMMTGPDFESLRDEPRFQDLLRRMNLPIGK
jgi:tetratricopeptide (TPR) repeat protein